MISKIVSFFKERSFSETLAYAYNGFCIPALLIHEAIHYLAIKSTRSAFNGVSIVYGDNYDKTGELAFKISWIPRNTKSNKIISISPIVILPLFLALCLFLTNIVTVSMLVYLLLCYKQSIPSKCDFESFNEIVKSSDYDFNLVLNDEIPNIEK